MQDVNGTTMALWRKASGLTVEMAASMAHLTPETWSKMERDEPTNDSDVEAAKRVMGSAMPGKSLPGRGDEGWPTRIAEEFGNDVAVMAMRCSRVAATSRLLLLPPGLKPFVTDEILRQLRGLAARMANRVDEIGAPATCAAELIVRANVDAVARRMVTDATGDVRRRTMAWDRERILPQEDVATVALYEIADENLPREHFFHPTRWFDRLPATTFGRDYVNLLAFDVCDEHSRRGVEGIHDVTFATCAVCRMLTERPDTDGETRTANIVVKNKRSLRVKLTSSTTEGRARTYMSLVDGCVHR